MLKAHVGTVKHMNVITAKTAVQTYTRLADVHVYTYWLHFFFLLRIDVGVFHYDLGQILVVM